MEWDWMYLFWIVPATIIIIAFIAASANSVTAGWEGYLKYKEEKR